jgi:serine/threonine-protein kinase
MLEDHLLVKTLGAGGFGAVYLALQAPLWNRTAAKCLHRDPDPSAHAQRVALLEAEARSLAMLSHPNIVRLIKFGVSRETPYLVMEYVDGAMTLGAEVRRRHTLGQPLSTREMRHVLSQVLDALGAAHALHIVHRDLKPDNVMLQAVHGNPLMVRLVDFGLAKVVAETSQTQMLAGTPM